MSKKFFALMTFLALLVNFSVSYADVAWPEPRPRKIETAAISIQNVNEKNKTVTIKIVRQSEGIVGYVYTVKNLSNKNIIVSGNKSFGNDNNSKITFHYPITENNIPENLSLEVKISESKVPTPYGVKIRKNSLVRNYFYIIEFSRNSKGKLTAYLFE